MDKLQNLHTCNVVPLAGGVEGIQLNSSFKENIRVLICGGYVIANNIVAKELKFN